jgi:hypothetical protein
MPVKYVIAIIAILFLIWLAAPALSKLGNHGCDDAGSYQQRAVCENQTRP